MTAEFDGERPFVSVVVTVYNGADVVTECIESILRQTYGNFEILIADDASTDQSLERVRQLHDPRIRILNPVGKKLGLHGNWSRAYQAANGVYLKHVCHDDLLEPDCLEFQVAMLETYPHAAVVCGRRRIIDAKGRKVLAAHGNRFTRVRKGATCGTGIRRYSRLCTRRYKSPR